MRSDSNSATIASTLNRSRPTGSVGSCTDPPILSLTSRLVRSSRIRRASGSDPRETVKLRDDQRVAAAARRERLTQPGSLPIGAGQPVIDVRALGAHTKRCERISLRREVLIVSCDTGITDQQRGHGFLLFARPAAAAIRGPFGRSRSARTAAPSRAGGVDARAASAPSWFSTMSRWGTSLRTSATCSTRLPPAGESTCAALAFAPHPRRRAALAITGASRGCSRRTRPCSRSESVPL